MDARAQQVDGEFTVLAGSIIVPEWHGVGKADSTVKAYASYRAQHERLVEEGAIVVQNGHGHLARDVVFSSPSTAGAIALGRSCNGRREWISPAGTFGDWESRGVEQMIDNTPVLSLVGGPRAGGTSGAIRCLASAQLAPSAGAAPK